MHKFSRLGIKSSHHEEISLRGDHISSLVRDVELVLDHDSLGHVVHNFIGVDELCTLLQIKDSWEYGRFKTVFQLEVAGEMLREELTELLIYLVGGPAVGE